MRMTLGFTTDGKPNIALGLSGPDLIKLVEQGQPIAMDLSDIGIEAHLIIIGRASDEECAEAFQEATGEQHVIIDKRSHTDVAIGILNGDIKVGGGASESKALQAAALKVIYNNKTGPNGNYPNGSNREQRRKRKGK